MCSAVWPWSEWLFKAESKPSLQLSGTEIWTARRKALWSRSQIWGDLSMRLEAMLIRFTPEVIPV